MPRWVEWIGFVVAVPPGPGREGSEEHLARHRVTMAEVEQAVLFGAPDSTAWHDDPDRGRRLYVRGTTHSGRRLFIVLRPFDPYTESYAVVTAYDDRSAG